MMGSMAGTRRGRQGTATGTVYQSPARAKRQARQRRQEEARWARLAGPVTVRRVDESTEPDERDTP